MGIFVSTRRNNFGHFFSTWWFGTFDWRVDGLFSFLFLFPPQVKMHQPTNHPMHEVYKRSSTQRPYVAKFLKNYLKKKKSTSRRPTNLLWNELSDFATTYMESKWCPPIGQICVCLWNFGFTRWASFPNHYLFHIHCWYQSMLYA